MSAFKLEFATDNAAFDEECGTECDTCCRTEVARILRAAAEQIEQHGPMSLRDANGNTVGAMEFTFDA